ncbi:hypothetical protein Nepgr_022090 [Nepenthes gracilis]|uniref:BZIP domain-containing protein n=1 Tax=Nepenthes gracilis TaxID=150966 RepID=A0AAD3XXQ1_NEPGR|nr:hypothetical protein Nepgr_022090 [Nepenthes gracilis]
MGSQEVDNASMPKPPSLSRQGSLYSLTLDEVQTQLGNLGKPLSSMNLDELLRSVWSAEANHFTGTAAIDDGATNPGKSVSISSPYKQSSLSLSRGLSKKTVDEVWKEIQRGKMRNSTSRQGNQESQHPLGEMTLEDFLVEAGVVEPPPRSGNNGSVGSIVSTPHHAQWMQYQLIPQQQQQNRMMSMFMPGHHVQQPISGAISDSGCLESQVPISPSGLVGTLSDTQLSRRKRVSPGDVVEKTVERRQKRMIKNRESAARSRARKQAYTHELENKVSRLEEENKRLKRLKELENVLPCVPIPEPKYRLRRTSSAPV